MTTRSAVLGHGMIPAGGLVSAYTTPISIVALLKTIHVSFRTAAAWSVGIYVRPAGGSDQTQLVSAGLTSGELFEWSGWVVMEAGDSLLLAVNSVDGDYWISGTELLAP